MKISWPFIAVNAFMLTMLCCLLGAIPVAYMTGNPIYLLGLFAFVFFAI